MTPSPSLHSAWLAALAATLDEGETAAPRGKMILERLAVTIRFDGSRPLLVHPLRGLNYRFAAAEFLWMAAGMDDVAPLVRYNSKMAAFSDDGIRLAGAYGPRLAPQWDYVVAALRADLYTRQAVAVIWTPSPGPSKDIPCTVSAQFIRRAGRLHGIWSMRSSDLWLGLPYDAFTFARLTACVAGTIGAELGDVVIVAGSSHLYREDQRNARSCVLTPDQARSAHAPALPGFPPCRGSRELLATGRRDLGGSAWDLRPWSSYAAALECSTSAEALAILETA